MSSDDKLTMALYQQEQSDAAARSRANTDLQFVFHKAMECNRLHNGTPANQTGFCDACLDDLRHAIQHHSIIHTLSSELFQFTEVDICALFRQTFHTHISHEGTSGPAFHGLLERLRTFVGRDRYGEYVARRWPERLKPDDQH